MSALHIPAFDPDNPDVEILEAFEKVRAQRAHAYSFDVLADSDPEEFERVHDAVNSDEAIELERVTGNWATTPAAVANQLAVVLTIECERWVDAGLMGQGWRALYQQRHRLDGRDQLIIQAAYELLHIEFEQAWDAYEQSAPKFDLALKIRDRVPKEATELDALADQLETALCNDTLIHRVIHALAPDLECYQRKAKMALKEGYADDAAAWLVRDVNFLLGEIVLDEPVTVEAA